MFWDIPWQRAVQQLLCKDDGIARLGLDALDERTARHMLNALAASVAPARSLNSTAAHSLDNTTPRRATGVQRRSDVNVAQVSPLWAVSELADEGWIEVLFVARWYAAEATSVGHSFFQLEGDDKQPIVKTAILKVEELRAVRSPSAVQARARLTHCATL